jgi:hypothetical protein
LTAVDSIKSAGIKSVSAALNPVAVSKGSQSVLFMRIPFFATNPRLAEEYSMSSGKIRCLGCGFAQYKAINLGSIWLGAALGY